jgi:hypothetical protein
MKKVFFAGILAVFAAETGSIFAQTNPAITSWLINTNGQKSRRYAAGSSTLINGTDSVNVQRVLYSNNFVYVKTKGLPAYPTGPFQDGNPSTATNQNAIFKFPLNPVQNTGTPTATSGGNIGVFINGVALFDYRDGVAWNANTNALCGGPGNPPCPGGMNANLPWNRDAIPAEKPGFDCAKGHPAMGNYHHHQNPSAFRFDLNVISNVCDLYTSDGLYTIDSTQHSPLIGFAYDGFPIYGAYGFRNADGSGGVARMKSAYQKRNITSRTTSPTGQAVTSGPAVSSTYYLGYFREDYEFVAGSSPDVLDVHNGRFAVTPEYPNGTYAYYCTVDASWNSTYPYVVGPTFYGTTANRKVTSITESVTIYTPNVTEAAESILNKSSLVVFPNPAKDFAVVQSRGVNRTGLLVELLDFSGKLVQTHEIPQGSTFCLLDLQTLYAGYYNVRVRQGSEFRNIPLLITE